MGRPLLISFSSCCLNAEYGVNDLLYTSEYEPSTGDAYQPLAGASRLLGTSERAALERMLRTLLQLPGRPAVVLFEAYAFPVAARLGGERPATMSRRLLWHSCSALVSGLTMC